MANALQAETIGVQKCLQRAADLGMTRIILETDAVTLGKALTSSCLDRSSNGCLFRQIREFIAFHFQYCYVSICSRVCIASLDDGSSLYKSHMPDFVSPLVSNDLIGTRG